MVGLFSGWKLSDPFISFQRSYQFQPFSAMFFILARKSCDRQTANRLKLNGTPFSPLAGHVSLLDDSFPTRVEFSLYFDQIINFATEHTLS